MVKDKLTWRRRFGAPLRRLDKYVKLRQIKCLLLVLQKYATPFRRFLEMTTISAWCDREDRMRKVEIVNRIAEETGLTKVKAEEAVDAILEEVKWVLQQGESVILRRFGSFQVREKRARLGRNPKTGKEAGIPARRVVRFKSGKYFKAAVDGEPA
jgi:DNA-binding protein HU-beta